MVKLSSGFSGINAGPRLPPLRNSVNDVRSRSEDFEAGWWHPWQCFCKMGRTSRVKLGTPAARLAAPASSIQKALPVIRTSRFLEVYRFSTPYARQSWYDTD